MDERPLPRVGDCVRIAVDGVGEQGSEDAVVDRHKQDGEQERNPVLVERDHSQHHEEVEVGLGDSSRELDDHG
jgi:hypothetical protein